MVIPKCYFIPDNMGHLFYWVRGYFPQNRDHTKPQVTFSISISFRTKQCINAYFCQKKKRKLISLVSIDSVGVKHKK